MTYARYPSRDLYISTLEVALTGEVTLFVNQDIEFMAKHHGVVMEESASQGVRSNFLGISSTESFMASQKKALKEENLLAEECYSLPGVGVVVRFYRDFTVDITQTVVNVSKVWADALGFNADRVYIDRSFDFGTPMSLEELLTLDSTEGFILIFGDEQALRL